ncbi:GGDEF domain-containing protein [Paenibacillus thalictri]|uniref:GGDEF domain-containing protein n=1 Tax=Paenibacillus thalictri TaxID=2527873 RepID=A0A4Q9DFW4_9BACL|nr:GGDEF domain-containing protein [Paenibacillus thalictri]TBL70904.1 GGDEF domain-containing protein [Paenibacillus thalictri]
MKYTGRIVIMSVFLVLYGIVRVYGNVYYNFPYTRFPYLGIIALAICWWMGGQYDKVKFYSEKDVLTGICNRRHVIQIFPKIIERIGKRDGILNLFLIDVDNFKKINDTYGHETGDKVLQYTSNILLSNTAKTDIVARWAGDEFLIISPYSDASSGDATIHRIDHALKKLSAEMRFEVSVSIGVAMYPNDAKTLDALLHVADCNMYEIKSKQKA